MNGDDLRHTRLPLVGRLRLSYLVKPVDDLLNALAADLDYAVAPEVALGRLQSTNLPVGHGGGYPIGAVDRLLGRVRAEWQARASGAIDPTAPPPVPTMPQPEEAPAAAFGGREQAAQQLQSAQFRLVHRQGYATAAVDAFVSTMITSLRSPASAAELITMIDRSSFPMARRGYDPADVDDLLDAVRATLAAEG